MASSGAIKAGQAFVEIYADDSKLTRSLKTQSAKIKNFGAGFAKAGSILAGTGVSVGLAFVPAINAASDLEETMNKFNVVFGDSSSLVKAWGDDFAGNVGRSKQLIADFLASSQDLLVPMGLEPGAATAMSKQLTSLAVDLASFNNMNDADVVRDLHAALTGSGEVMKKYGVIVSQAAVNQELLNMGLHPKNVSEAEKAQARMNIIMAGTTAAQGDAIRSSGSYANQMKRLNATFEDTKAVIGSAVLPIITPLITKAGDMIVASSNWIKENKGLVSGLFIAAGGAAALGGIMISGAGAIVAAGFAVGGLASALGTVLSPIGLVIAGLGSAGAAVLYFTGVGSTLINWVRDLASEWEGSWNAIGSALSDGNIQGAFDVFVASLKVAWYETTDFLGDTLESSLMSAWGTITKLMPDEWKEMILKMSDMFSAFMQSIDSGRTKIVNKIAEGIVRGKGKITGASQDDIEFEVSQIANQDDFITNAIKQRKNGRSNLTNALDSFLKGPEENTDNGPATESDELRKARLELEKAIAANSKNPVLPEPTESEKEKIQEAYAGPKGLSTGGGRDNATNNVATINTAAELASIANALSGESTGTLDEQKKTNSKLDRMINDQRKNSKKLTDSMKNQLRVEGLRL